MNQQEFDAGVLAQIDAIRRIGRGRLRRSSDLDDFTQEVVIRLYAGRDQLRDSGRLPQWASVTARNLAVQWNRKRAPVAMSALPELPPEAQPEDDSTLIAERWHALVSALGALDPVERDLLVSFYVDDIGYAELQQRNGLSYSAVGVRLHRAKRKLRNRLGWLVASVAALFHTPHARAFGAQPMAISRVSTAFLAGFGATVTCAIGFGWAASTDTDANAADPAERVIYVQTQGVSKTDEATTLHTEPDVALVTGELPSDDASLGAYHLVPQPTLYADFQHTDHDVGHATIDLASDDASLAVYHLAAQPALYLDFQHIGHLDHDVIHLTGDLARGDGHLEEYDLVAQHADAQHADHDVASHDEQHAEYDLVSRGADVEDTDHDVVHLTGDLASNDAHLAEYDVVAPGADVEGADHDVVHLTSGLAGNDAHLAEYDVVARPAQDAEFEHVHHVDYDVVSETSAEAARSGKALPGPQTTADDPRK